MLEFLQDWWWALLIGALIAFIFAQGWVMYLMIVRNEDLNSKYNIQHLVLYRTMADMSKLETGHVEIVDSYEQDFHSFRERIFDLEWDLAHEMNSAWDRNIMLEVALELNEQHETTCLPDV